jgi:Protein of unknown function (DUF3795)
MKMPRTIAPSLVAPCGVNCAVCYVHLRQKKPCAGCNSEVNKPNRCRSCKIMLCAAGRGVTHCFLCEAFPCQQIKRLDRSYRRRYSVRLIENARAQAKGIARFLRGDRERWTCPHCSGVVSLHDGVCSECGV